MASKKNLAFIRCNFAVGTVHHTYSYSHNSAAEPGRDQINKQKQESYENDKTQGAYVHWGESPQTSETPYSFQKDGYH